MSKYIESSTARMKMITVYSLLFLLGTYLSLTYYYPDPNLCEMVYMRPTYAELTDFSSDYSRLGSKYRLFLYKEYGQSVDLVSDGIPVLFIPGNAGSYKQVRSIASKMADTESRFDFFTADFTEDFTAFHGKTIIEQAEYVNDAIKFILDSYPKAASESSPKAVIIIGHSMGGIVARTVLTLNNYQIGSVNTILTLATPHALPPLTFDRDVNKVYTRVNEFWRESFSLSEAQNTLSDVVLVSIAGGMNDAQVPSDYAEVASCVPPSNGFSVYTTGIPEVWTSIDHLAILWCRQLRNKVVEALVGISDLNSTERTLPRAHRLSAFRSVFLGDIVAEQPYEIGGGSIIMEPVHEGHTVLTDAPRVVLCGTGCSSSDTIVPASKKDLYLPTNEKVFHYREILDSRKRLLKEQDGHYFYEVLPNSIHLDSTSALRMLFKHRLYLPSGVSNVYFTNLRSSLISLRISLKVPPEELVFQPMLKVSTHDEEKWFVNFNSTVVSMHATNPYVTSAGDNLIGLHLFTPYEKDKMYGLTISVDIFGSMGNLISRYRTLLACWPLGISWLLLIMQLSRYRRGGHFPSFESAAKRLLKCKTICYVCGVLGFVHLLSTSEFLRHLLHLTRIPNTPTSSVDAMLPNAVYNDLILGINEKSLGVILVTVFYLVSFGLVFAMHGILSLLTSLLSLVMKKKQQPGGKKLSSVSNIYDHLFVVLAVSVVLLYFVPFQFAFVLLTLRQIYTTAKAKSLMKEDSQTFATYYNQCAAFLLLMMWTLLINLPFLAMWIHNLNLHWTITFSSVSNILLALPIALFVGLLSNGTVWYSAHSRVITLVQLAPLFYTVWFAFVFGVLNTYMLHNLLVLFCLIQCILAIVSEARNGQLEDKVNMEASIPTKDT